MKVQFKAWLPALAGAVTGILSLLVLSGGDAAGPAGAVRARSAPHAYIVQARSAAEAGRAVAQAGGEVRRELSVIRAVSALLDERELAALRRASVPLLEIYDDAPVQASSSALPETYYPSEIGAHQLQLHLVLEQPELVLVVVLEEERGLHPEGGGQRLDHPGLLRGHDGHFIFHREQTLSCELRPETGPRIYGFIVTFVRFIEIH